MFANPNSGANVALSSVLKKFANLLNGLRGWRLTTGKRTFGTECIGVKV
jgi:hypothetical protein